MAHVLVKKLLLLGLCVIPFFSYSQSFKSALYSSSLGVYAMGSMPSLLVDTDAKWDIQIAGAQFNFFNSDNSGQTLKKELISSMLSSNPKNFFSVKSSNAFVEAQLALPSFSYALNENNVIGFSSSIRSFSYENNSGFSLFEIIQQVKENGSFTGGYLDEFMTMISNNWLELGVSYSRNFRLNEDWSVQAGLSTKFLSGVASGQIDLGGFDGNILNSRVENLSASVSFIYNDEIDKILENGTGEIDLFSKNGYSLDFGLSTKWKEKLTVAISILDIGSIKYKSSQESSVYEIQSESVDLESFTEINSLNQLADSIDSQVLVEGEEVNSFKTKLPMRIFLFGKYDLNKTFGIVGSMQVTRLSEGISQDRHHLIWDYNISPTVRIRKMTFCVPIGYSEFAGFRTGMGLQWRFLTIGSDNLLSYYFSNSDTRAMSIYCSFRLKVGRYNM
ncbi:DUF5723 family protein [Reichenbachiella sp.]|uniref:DUF5723 family protein n=1 Tax=Reichenbachiella sp. TaxID=2184521 RepID=UPI003B5A65F8